jgi:hypothetical protein
VGRQISKAVSEAKQWKLMGQALTRPCGTPEAVELVPRMRRERDDIGRNTIKRVLLETAIDASPERGKRTSWSAFVRADRQYADYCF